jgi:hypothetical protein
MGGINRVNGRNTLSVILINGLPDVMPEVILIRDFSRAFLSARSAGCAFFGVYISGFAPNLDSKIASGSFDSLNVAVRNYFDIGVLCESLKLWGEYTRGAIVGWKSLVELGHDAPDARLFVHQIHPETGFSQV